MAGAKRAPSSLVQLTSSTGALVVRSLSCSVRNASSAARTPSGPSNLPPVGWVSRWEPIAIGGSCGFLPGRRANILPTSSTVTLQPSARLRLEPIADLPVEIGQREAANAAFCGGADL